MANGTYSTDGYQKHKWPNGWGSICPDDLAESPQALLESGVRVGDSVFNVCGDYALQARQHIEGRWHGHPIPWSRLPAEAKNALIEAGRLTPAKYLKALRKNLGRDYAQ